MKLTEFKCPACGGSVKPDPENPGIVECEYCHNRFTVEEEHRPVPAADRLVSYTPLGQPERKEDGEFRWKHGVLIVFVLVGAMLVMFGPQLYRKQKENQVSSQETGNRGAAGGQTDLPAAEDGDPKAAAKEALAADPVFSAFCEAVFSKPASSLTETELSEIKWLELGNDVDNWKIGYSLESPTENPEAELTWFSFSREEFPEADPSCIPAFPALSFVGSSQTLPAGTLSGLPITGIKGYFDSLEAAAALVDDPAAVTWLDISGSSIDLSAIGQFSGLETLVLDGVPEDEKLLVQTSGLKSLTLDLYDGEMDFTTAAMIPGLERLTISCKNLRDISFVAKMEHLKALRLEQGAMISVEPLGSCAGLTELAIERCDEIQDLSAVSRLTNLKKLSLDLPYQCPEPDLSALTQMEELRLSKFEQAGFLKAMTNLVSLTLDSCPVADPGVFAGLTGLKHLSCTSFGAMQSDYSYIEHMTGLESVDLHGTETYDDLSGIFNLPALKSLNLSGMSCEIDFDRIGENTVLKELSMDHMKLYKNVSVSGGNGIYSVDWDDVSLPENLSFLGKLKALETLSVRENELTELSFATELSALQNIDFSENYVTDISPLSGLKNLKTVTGINNPVSNYEVLGGPVVIYE